MIKKITAVLVLLGLIMGNFSVAYGETNADYSNYENATIAVWSGSICEVVSRTVLPNAKYEYYNGAADLAMAVKTGKADLCAIAESFFAAMQEEAEGLEQLGEPYGTFGTVALITDTERGKQIKADFDAFVQRYADTDEFIKIRQGWLTKEGMETREFPLAPKEGEKGTIVYAFAIEDMPAAFLRDGKPVGFEVEILSKFAIESGYGIDYVESSFADLLPNIILHKYDVVTGTFEYSEEHAQNALLSEPYVEEKLIYFKKAEVNDEDFLAAIKSGFVRTFITEDRYQMFITGFGYTMLMICFAVLFGTGLGFLLYLWVRTGNSAAKWFAKMFRNLFDGIPIVVLLMIFYYVIFGSLNIANYWVASIVFTLTFASGMLTQLETGVATVGIGQYEAGIALGYTDFQTFKKIVLPQAWRNIMPSYAGNVIATLKGTAIVGYIAVMDLTRVTDIIRSRTYDAFFPLLAAAIVYYILIQGISLLVQYIQKKYLTNNGTKETILKGVRTDD